MRWRGGRGQHVDGKPVARCGLRRDPAARQFVCGLYIRSVIEGPPNRSLDRSPAWCQPVSAGDTPIGTHCNVRRWVDCPRRSIASPQR
jgi:hypothetical protein